MKIAILGYGRMGKQIEEILLQRNHEVVLKINEDNLKDFTPKAIAKADVAIEFSNPDAAFDNIISCFRAGVPVVSGTTGWLDRKPEAETLCKENDTAFIYASNFSLGVNLFFHLNRQLAQLMNNYPGYDVQLQEIHHTKKLDAPSGTAITLAEDLLTHLDRKQKWVKQPTDDDAIPVRSERIGDVPGIHEITYESEFDKIHIKHEAKSRKGFAFGAVLAAEFITNKKGIYTMEDVLSIG